MARCIYEPGELDALRLRTSTGHCIDVPERWFARQHGVLSGAEGLVTSGAGPCLVVAVHDTERDIGCLAHMTENLTDEKTFNLADEVIEHMLAALELDERPATAQIMLFQGRNRFQRYPAYLRESGVLGRCIIDSHIGGPDLPNYAYFPGRAQVFAVSRPAADALGGARVEQRRYTVDHSVCAWGPDFLTDFSSRWGDFVHA